MGKCQMTLLTLTPLALPFDLEELYDFMKNARGT